MIENKAIICFIILIFFFSPPSLGVEDGTSAFDALQSSMSRIDIVVGGNDSGQSVDFDQITQVSSDGPDMSVFNQRSTGPSRQNPSRTATTPPSPSSGTQSIAEGGTGEEQTNRNRISQPTGFSQTSNSPGSSATSSTAASRLSPSSNRIGSLVYSDNNDRKSDQDLLPNNQNTLKPHTPPSPTAPPSSQNGNVRKRSSLAQQTNFNHSLSQNNPRSSGLSAPSRNENKDSNEEGSLSNSIDPQKASGFYPTKRSSSSRGLSRSAALNRRVQTRGTKASQRKLKSSQKRNFKDARFFQSRLNRGLASHQTGFSRKDRFLFSSMCRAYSDFAQTNNINLGKTDCPK